MPKKFWQFRNQADGSGELLLYGEIAGEKSWYGDEVTPKEFAKELNDMGYDKVYADSYDQADEASIKALLERMIERNGRVDVLVNNSVLRPMNDYDGPLEDFAKSMAVNSTGLFAITQPPWFN